MLEKYPELFETHEFKCFGFRTFVWGFALGTTEFEDEFF
jgi:hypothetical protein